jgi:dihydrofolate reductase
MIVSLIAAASTNNVIGKDNQLPWNLPNDMRFFHEHHLGHAYNYGQEDVGVDGQ